MIEFNKVNEFYVIKGKEKLVGYWLLGLGASLFGLLLL